MSILKWFRRKREPSSLPFTESQKAILGGRITSIIEGNSLFHHRKADCPTWGAEIEELDIHGHCKCVESLMRQIYWRMVEVRGVWDRRYEAREQIERLTGISVIQNVTSANGLSLEEAVDKYLESHK